MDRIREPSTILSIGNSVSILALAMYFYKQTEALKVEVSAITDALQTVAEKLSVVEKSVGDKTDFLQTFGEKIKEVNEKIEDIPSTIDEVISSDMSEIVKALANYDIQVDIPSKKNRTEEQKLLKYKPAKLRKSKAYVYESDDDEIINQVRSQVLQHH